MLSHCKDGIGSLERILISLPSFVMMRSFMCTWIHSCVLLQCMLVMFDFNLAVCLCVCACAQSMCMHTNLHNIIYIYEIYNYIIYNINTTQRSTPQHLSHSILHRTASHCIILPCLALHVIRACICGYVLIRYAHLVCEY